MLRRLISYSTLDWRLDSPPHPRAIRVVPWLKPQPVIGTLQVLSNAFTFTAVPSAIVHAGGEPVYVDCEPNYVLDLPDLEAKMKSSGAKWLVVSHMRGKLSDMDAIAALCKHYGVRFIEDCAHSLGVRLPPSMPCALRCASASLDLCFRA